MKAKWDESLLPRDRVWPVSCGKQLHNLITETNRESKAIRELDNIRPRRMFSSGANNFICIMFRKNVYFIYITLGLYTIRLCYYII